jgi:aminodeoxyfutalosine synthase
MNGLLYFSRAGLADIAEKVFAGTRLSFDDGVRLYDCRDLQAVGLLADGVRERRHGARASYVLNMYLNYSNVCVLACQFCAFARRPGQEGAWEYGVPAVVERVRAGVERGGITEVHIVGGLHPKLPWSYYLEMVKALKGEFPGLMVKAFTAIEIRHFAKAVARRPIPQVLAELAEAGLDSLTGGGAEIFAPAVRERICRGKETAEEWLDVHRLWHRLGKRSTCTMLYGHIESAADRVDHLLRLRGLQDETGGFTGFVPFAFQPEGTERSLRHLRRANPMDDLRNLAVARLMLDNFQHITAYWISIGLPVAQIALSYGVNDLHGTIQEERIFHMAGATTPQQQTRESLERAIREAGRTPCQRDTYYEPVALAAAC